jgi:hypothetical protein
MAGLGTLLLVAGGIYGASKILGGSGSASSDGVTRTPVRAIRYTPPPVAMSEAPPPGSPPPRIPLPAYNWQEVSGTVRVESMARTPRFPPAAPGYQDVTLAELVPQGTRRPLTVFADVLVTDATIPLGERGTSTATLVDLIQRTHLHTLDEAALQGGPTVHGERLARDFRVVAGDLVGASRYDTMALLEHNDHEPPSTLRLYTGRECTDQADPPEGWRAALQAIGFDQQEKPPVLFHATKCAPAGMAYETRGGWTRYYNLRLEGRGSGVVLVARIARLPAVQVLTWRAVFAVLLG